MSLYQPMRLSLLAAICMLALTSIAAQEPRQQAPSPQLVERTAEQPSRVAGRSSLYCAGYVRYQRLPKTPQIVGAEQEQEQRNFSEGNVVYINAGSQQGLKDGQEFQIIRPRGDVKGVYRQKDGFLGTYVEEVGQLQIFKVREATSAAQITFSCGMVMFGDLLVPVPDRTAPAERADVPFDRFADPSGKQKGRLMMARDGREMVTRSDVVYIDLGSEDKISEGDYLTIYRPLGTGNLTTMDNEESARGRATGFQSDSYRGGGFSIMGTRAKDSTGFVDTDGRYRYKPITTKQIKRDRPLMPRKIVGEMVIINVQTRTATAVITRAVTEIHTGDWVEIQ